MIGIWETIFDSFGRFLESWRITAWA